MLFGKIKMILKRFIDFIDFDEDTLFHIMMIILVVGGILLFFFYAYGAAEETLRVWNES
jgi:hypothetical protein